MSTSGPTTQPRQNAPAAFKAILDAAELGVEVLNGMPYEGAPLRSVVLSIASGSSRKPALGLQVLPNTRALQENYRLQIDCYHDDQDEVKKLADAAEQAITDHLDDLRATYGIHDVTKVTDIDTAPVDPTARESRILMDFAFCTYRKVT